ncbi:cytochrome oxidase complex assembly protein 1-domain-containing protein [Schizothecium vesticola]|uniref:Cytochrome oxidase complex assembly protein 1-domain-containing protein n=1 Tax=Schizothecium vesticola TaxID=314040 RepID=A0AA40K046_9PEZI|nr:cytochrome oxidase complex assembly protein 1-domain-containing protein [Schizothecium vesticola]
MLSRIPPLQRTAARRRLLPSLLGHNLSRPTPQFPTLPAARRTLVSAPRPGSGPLMERRSDRELPDLPTTNRLLNWRTLPLFLALLAAASVAIFNYQKLSSPVIAGTLYALRTSPLAREYLGDEVSFAADIPWISGGMNQVKGRIDVSFRVKGTRARGTMRFVSRRPSPRGVFETDEWSLTTDDGRRIDLLDGGDPFRAMVGLAEEGEEEGEEKRGWRK